MVTSSFSDYLQIHGERLPYSLDLSYLYLKMTVLYSSYLIPSVNKPEIFNAYSFAERLNVYCPSFTLS